LPKSVKPETVLLTISPVTQVADVAVKKASVREMLSPEGVETGSISRKVPTAIAPVKLIISARAGLFANNIIARFYNKAKHKTRA